MQNEISDVFLTYEDALAEAERVKSESKNKGMVTKVTNSPYGRGFIVRTFPVRFLMNRRLSRDVRLPDYMST